MRAVVTSLVLLLFAAVGFQAQAAEINEAPSIRIGDEDVQKISLAGPIVAGDAGKLEELISDDSRTVVALSGEGGDYQEALAIAKLFSNELVMTIVEDRASCLGACAIAFLGGNQDTDDSGDYAAARSLAPTARLGLSVPRPDLADMPLTKDSVEGAYSQLLKFIADFLGEADDLFLGTGAVAELVKPQNGGAYMVDDAYRLAHIGVEIQGVAPPPALTLSMARNLCQLGWHATEDKPEARTDEAIGKLQWKQADASFAAQSDHFGEGLPVRRTVIPFDFMSEDEGDGYAFCLVDQAKENGTLQVACRGFIYADDVAGAMERARTFDGRPEEGQSGEGDIACNVPTLIEPLSRLGSTTPANRWALVPGDTPLDKIAGTLAGYAAKEPPL
jgi:hypothetical protein